MYQLHILEISCNSFINVCNAIFVEPPAPCTHDKGRYSFVVVCSKCSEYVSTSFVRSVGRSISMQLTIVVSAIIAKLSTVNGLHHFSNDGPAGKGELNYNVPA